MLLDSFELSAVDIAEVDLDDLHALSMSVRWPHRPDDWRMLIGFGRGIAALDEIGRVVGSAMWFPYSDRFTTVGMVITAPRLQALGAGAWLMDHVLAAAGPRAVGLNATRAAFRLYRSLGFEPEGIVSQCQGEAVPTEGDGIEGGRLRVVAPEDLPALAALDERAFGTSRAELLARLLPISRGVALLRGEEIEAYALCRPFGRGHVIGPLVARSDADAIAVARPHVAEHAGRFLRVDTRQQEGEFPAFLQRSGMPIYDTVTTMALRRPWLLRDGAGPGAPLVYGLAMQALS